MAPAGTQNFESVCFIEARLIAFAGETTDVDTTSTSPKISNLFFIFPLSFRFVLWMANPFFWLRPQKFFAPSLGVGEKLPHKTPPYIFLGNKDEIR